MDCPWFSPVCDDLLAAFKKMYVNYENGKAYATRPYIGQQDNTIKYQDKVTIYLHKLAFRQAHTDHLLRILQTLIPNRPVTKELKGLPSNLKRGKLQGAGYYIVEIAIYRGYVKEIVEALESAKSGSYRAAQISDIIAEDKEKSPFEL